MRMTLFGDTALLVEDEPAIDAAVNARILAISELVRGACVPGVRDVVPAFASFAVHFDPECTDVAVLRALVTRLIDDIPAADVEAPRDALEVPVCYGGRFGPDLAAVAAWGGWGPLDVVAAHIAGEYRVFMVGFLPGFPYLASVDERIAMPRRDTPRPHVAAGSVGIAGRQTGVYPFDSPGGWQIIGRTPLQLFDPHREPPALFSAGQRVRFRPITPSDFDAARRAGAPR